MVNVAIIRAKVKMATRQNNAIKCWKRDIGREYELEMKTFLFVKKNYLRCYVFTFYDDKFCFRFYLAFENSICTEYITEKFVRSNVWIVPIVLKDAIHRHIAPPNSYIAVDNFPNMASFVTYLKYLQTNMTAYMEYFLWRQSFEIKDSPYLCDLCDKLLNTRHITTELKNISDWTPTLKGCDTDFARRLHVE
jgi:hypothetical protein